jgi:hypothetical protein
MTFWLCTIYSPQLPRAALLTGRVATPDDIGSAIMFPERACSWMAAGRYTEWGVGERQS